MSRNNDRCHQLGYPTRKKDIVFNEIMSMLSYLNYSKGYKLENYIQK